MEDKDFNQIVKRFREETARNAFLPVVGLQPGATGSKYGGAPSFMKGDVWPSCASCQSHLDFLFQLDLSEVEKDGEIIQLYQCFSAKCEGLEEARSSRGVVTCIRVHRSNSKVLFDNPPVRLRKEIAISKWFSYVDYPSYQDQENLLGLTTAYEHDEISGQVSKVTIQYKGDRVAVTPGEAEILERLCYRNDKLRGWPDWIQDSEYPECPECLERMTFLFQLLDGLHVELELATGRGYLFQCDKHRDVVLLVSHL